MMKTAGDSLRLSIQEGCASIWLGGDLVADRGNTGRPLRVLPSQVVWHEPCPKSVRERTGGFAGEDTGIQAKGESAPVCAESNTVAANRSCTETFGRRIAFHLRRSYPGQGSTRAQGLKP